MILKQVIVTQDIFLLQSHIGNHNQSGYRKEGTQIVSQINLSVLTFELLSYGVTWLHNMTILYLKS
jgi:hypothetical protein